jgi:hypothetical protein
LIFVALGLYQLAPPPPESDILRQRRERNSKIKLDSRQLLLVCTGVIFGS